MKEIAPHHFIPDNLGRKHTDVSRLHMSEAIKKRFASGYVHPMKGKHHTDDARRKMILTRQEPPINVVCPQCGKGITIEPYKLRMGSKYCSNKCVGDSLRGKTRPQRSLEWREHLSESHKGQPGWLTGGHWSKEMKERMSKAHLGKKVWNSGMKGHYPYPSPRKGKHHTEIARAKLRAARALRVMPYKDTAPERAVQGYLTDNGIPYVKHRVMSAISPQEWKGHQFDIVIEDRHIAIEVNGCRYHDCPLNCTNKISKINEAIDRDRLIKESVEAAGWKMIWVWEHDVKNGMFINQLNEIFQRSGEA